MLKTKLLVIALGAAFALPVMAEDAPASGLTPSSNVTITSNYLYRGMQQTGGGAAIQGGFDLAHSSGAYAGVWGSSISWLGDGGAAANAGTELDTYIGFGGEAGDVGYDLGYLRYNYPGIYTPGTISADTDELYAAVTYSIVTAKLSYSMSDLFGVVNSKGSTYMELNAEYAVGESGVSLGAHIGKQAIANNSASDYSDYNISASKDFSGYSLALTYSTTDVASTNSFGVSTGVVSLSHSF
ncbi:MAG: TorF family putative porin [Gallionellaceae bacterium]